MFQFNFFAFCHIYINKKHVLPTLIFGFSILFVQICSFYSKTRHLSHNIVNPFIRKKVDFFYKMANPNYSNACNFYALLVHHVLAIMYRFVNTGYLQAVNAGMLKQTCYNLMLPTTCQQAVSTGLLQLVVDKLGTSCSNKLLQVCKATSCNKLVATCEIDKLVTSLLQLVKLTSLLQVVKKLATSLLIQQLVNKL